MRTDHSPTAGTQGPGPAPEKGRQAGFGGAEAESPCATVILPAYNEAEALPEVLADLFAVVDGCYEVVVVDDGSTDGTAAVAQQFPCRILRHEQNRGKGCAVRTGLEEARGRAVIVMDADASYPAEAIPGMVALLEEKDLVRGVREDGKGHMPLINQVGNVLFDFLLARVHGLEGSDCLSGLYGLRREVLLEMDLEADGFDLEVEIGIKARARDLEVATVPIAYQARIGEKKLDAWRDGWRILNKVLFMLLTHNPFLTFVVPGLVVMGVAVAGAVVLRTRALVTPYFGLDVHSFILASLGVLAGFQLAVFGLAARLYSIETGCRPGPWLVRLSSARLRLGAAGIGLGLFVGAVAWIAHMGHQWLAHGAGDFEGTRELVLAATVLVGGLQLLSAALFVSIFAARIQRQARLVEGQRERAPSGVAAEA